MVDAAADGLVEPLESGGGTGQWHGWGAPLYGESGHHSSAPGGPTQAKGPTKRTSTAREPLESPTGPAIFFSRRHVIHRRCTVLPQLFHRWTIEVTA
jgi:hypothetical protein